VGWGLAAAGLVAGAALGGRSLRAAPPRPGARLAGVLALLGLVALLGARALGEPLQNWDARSIWFFHAKIVYFAGGLDAGAPWRELDFSHPDYPKLLPVLAAELARGAGLWNEYWPKAALPLLLLPAALAVPALARGPAAGVFLAALLFGRPYALLWNGQADAWLAIYAALAALGLGRGLAERRRPELILGLACLGVALNLKHEGLLALACLGASAGALAAVGVVRPPGLGSLRAAWLLALGGVPLLVWRAKACAWGLAADLELSAAALGRAGARLVDGRSPLQVAEALLAGQGFGPVAAVLGAALVACRLLGVPLPRAALLPLLGAGLYLAGLAAVYLGTPRELAWHLATSSHRTPLAALLLLGSAAAAALAALEGAPKRRGGCPGRATPSRVRHRPPRGGR